MKLAEFLDSAGINRSEFARVVNATPQAVDHWVEGRRTPKNEYMQRIRDATSGLVTANDFYNLPSSTT